MEDYFNSTLSKLKTKNYSQVTVVLGNESCDLDSAVSSLVYAIFLHYQYSQIRCGVCTRVQDVPGEVFVSVLDVDREDYELKTEVAYCLAENGVRKEQLVFRNDINIQEIVQSVKTNIILVDHHTISKRYDFLVPFVTEIIDHRPLNKTDWRYKDDTRSTIEIVGSCGTLIAQRIKDLSGLLGKDVDFFNRHPVCSQLLYSVILLDTVNFSREVKKGTPHDEEVVLFLESLLKPIDCEQERKTKLDRLVAARSDVSGLTPAQLLRKDVKIVGTILVPSFPILVEEFLSKPGAAAAVTEALALRRCTVGVLLGMRLGGALRRDMAVCGPDDALAASLLSYLEQWSDPPLRLERSKAGGAPGAGWGDVHREQLALAASRKQYIEPLTRFLANTSAATGTGIDTGIGADTIPGTTPAD